MPDTGNNTNSPSPFARDAHDPANLPDFGTRFISQNDLDSFAKALQAPEVSPVTALNDWRPVHQRVRRRGRPNKRKKKPVRSKDETREGFVYTLLKWPLLVFVGGWLLVLSILYLLTRFYIWSYEQTVTWRGYRQSLRQQLRRSTTYEDWRRVAMKLDEHLGNELWKEGDTYAYYDDATIRRVLEQLQIRRQKVETQLLNSDGASNLGTDSVEQAIHDLRSIVEACVKNNFAGIENPRIYSETYYGTKRLAQEFIDELESSLSLLLNTSQSSEREKFDAAQHMYRNFGRTALCLSGGAGFAYYHFGVAKALLDADLLPDVITGTSGGALVAALLGTRSNDELKRLLVPALAHRINACEDGIGVWSRRWYKTGARFDSLDWAEKCSWFCRGSTTFKEAYETTGRVLNITCIPSDPHSPTILANYITAPNCVIWSTVLASAAVPGILNPVVLMMKNRDGTLSPYSFGHKWKDGSLKTDIPIRALNMHFNVNFSIVSQVNPHINLFFFSSRGTVGRPVTHRRGRGWRGGFLGSALEQYLKLDLTKWLKVLRHLELLPRWMGQDWSEIWLQNFSGTITIWPRSKLSDFYHILSDPTPERLADMIHAGQLSTFSKLLFVENRMKVERLVEQGLKLGPAKLGVEESFHLGRHDREQISSHARETSTDDDSPDLLPPTMNGKTRRGSIIEELKRQSQVFFDDPGTDYETDRSSLNGDAEREEISMQRTL